MQRHTSLSQTIKPLKDEQDLLDHFFLLLARTSIASISVTNKTIVHAKPLELFCDATRWKLATAKKLLPIKTITHTLLSKRLWETKTYVLGFLNAHLGLTDLCTEQELSKYIADTQILFIQGRLFDAGYNDFDWFKVTKDTSTNLIVKEPPRRTVTEGIQKRTLNLIQFQKRDYNVSVTQQQRIEANAFTITVPEGKKPKPPKRVPLTETQIVALLEKEDATDESKNGNNNSQPKPTGNQKKPSNQKPPLTKQPISQQKKPLNEGRPLNKQPIFKQKLQTNAKQPQTKKTQVKKISPTKSTNTEEFSKDEQEVLDILIQLEKSASEPSALEKRTHTPTAPYFEDDMKEQLTQITNHLVMETELDISRMSLDSDKEDDDKEQIPVQSDTKLQQEAKTKQTDTKVESKIENKQIKCITLSDDDDDDVTDSARNAISSIPKSTKKPIIQTEQDAVKLSLIKPAIVSIEKLRNPINLTKKPKGQPKQQSELLQTKPYPTDNQKKGINREYRRIQTTAILYLKK